MSTSNTQLAEYPSTSPTPETSSELPSTEDPISDNEDFSTDEPDSWAFATYPIVDLPLSADNSLVLARLVSADNDDDYDQYESNYERYDWRRDCESCMGDYIDHNGYIWGHPNYCPDCPGCQYKDDFDDDTTLYPSDGELGELPSWVQGRVEEMVEEWSAGIESQEMLVESVMEEVIKRAREEGLIASGELASTGEPVPKE